MIAEYDQLLAEDSGTMLTQEGYGMDFHTEEETNKNASLVEIRIEYTERSKVAESKMSELENCLSMMDMD